MKVSDIFELEKVNINGCYLINEGLFWRVYEKSAFLFVKRIKQYSLIKRHYKVIDNELVYLGFPDKSLEEVLRTSNESGFTVTRKEGLIEITGFEDINGFAEWKNELDLFSNENKALPANETTKEFASPVIDAIRKFPVAERTPIECQQFIVELQNTINGTI
jgi:hypothetical protein